MCLVLYSDMLYNVISVILCIHLHSIQCCAISVYHRRQARQPPHLIIAKIYVRLCGLACSLSSTLKHEQSPDHPNL